jgi:5'-3' exonuclease
MKRGLVDLSSVIWTCLLAGIDKESGRKIERDGKTYQVNSWQYGYENAIEHLLHAMRDLALQPHEMIFVKEGLNSKANRQLVFADYKAKRDKCDEQYEQFTLCRDKIIDTFRSIGANICWQDGGVEGDDVLGYLALNLDSIIYIISGDKDLAQLVDGKRIHHWRAGVLDANPFGDFPHKYIPVYIALVGDSTDKIPGAPGFGNGKWIDMLIKFGDDAMELMEGLIKDRQLAKLSEDVGDFKPLQKILDNPDSVYGSYDCGRLQVEKVNTMRRPLQWLAGMVKPRALIEDHRLQKWGGVKRIVSAETYDQAKAWAAGHISAGPFVTLDVETSTPDESDEWLESMGKEEKAVDTFGAELTSLQLTFGANLQYSFYFPVDNIETEGCTNISAEQVAAFLDMIPRSMKIMIHNVSYELPVCYNSWGQLWADDPDYHGFLRNVRDTAIMSSYVNENLPRGLKDQSATRLGYRQQTYEELTVRSMYRDEWNGRGKVIHSHQEPQLEQQEVIDYAGNVIGTNEVHSGDREQIVVKYKMRDLTATECLDYGCDDVICTAALAVFFQIIMEIEKTLEVWEDVETYPAYLTALAYVQGTKFSKERMAAQEREDDKAYDEAWPVLRQYLIDVGFDGTITPTMLPVNDAAQHKDDKGELPLHILDYTPKGVKVAYTIVSGGRTLDTGVRMFPKLAKVMVLSSEEIEDEDVANRVKLLAAAVEKGDLEQINALIKQCYSGEPQLDLASPKQMARLIYDVMKAPIRVINDVTPLEREKNPALDAAVGRFKKKRAGSRETIVTEDDLALVRKKASGNDTALDMALAFDAEELDESAKKAMKAIGIMKKVMTRRSLFYKIYWKVGHWKDGLIRPNVNQCAAVTRRYSASLPNVQQLPKKGEGVKFRSCYLPHKPNAVIASIDYAGQELRLAAEVSQDKNMLACYVGDNLKDIHSITAAGAVPLKWDTEFRERMWATHGADLPRDVEGTYQMFCRVRALGKSAPEGKIADDLRKDSKNVNFGAQNGAFAVTLAEQLIMRVEDAQLFLDARAKMFPDVDKAAEREAGFAMHHGYALTLMGARRHLADSIMSVDKSAANRAARQAWNFKIQGSAGEMTKLGMKRIWLSKIFFRYDARFIAPIHDELVSSVVAEHAVDFLREKHAAMTGSYATMQVPILGSISVGPDFANQTECGEKFDEVEIRKALDKIFKPEALKEAA